MPWEAINAITTALAQHYGACRFDWHLGGTKMNSDGSGNGFDIPTGAIIATAELKNVWHIVANPGVDIDVAKHIPIGAESLINDKHASDFADYFIPTAQEMLFGDWTPGRYAWEIVNIKMLPKPIPAKGMQGLWNWNGFVA